MLSQSRTLTLENPEEAILDRLESEWNFEIIPLVNTGNDSILDN